MIPFRLVLVFVALAMVVGGCFSPLTEEEKEKLLASKERFDAAAERLQSVSADLERLKTEGERLRLRFESEEMSMGDFARAKAELEVFLSSVESKWREAKDDFESAAAGYKAVQKQIKDRSGSAVGAWLQAILGGFGVEIPVVIIAVLEWIRRKRRERQVGMLSRAGGKTRGSDGKDFGEALMEEMTPADRNVLRAVEKSAANGLL